jgi:hypothetical protein
MKFFVSIVLIALLAFACGLYFPWWSIAVASFIVALLIVQRPLWSFLAGFAAVFILWLLLVLTINAANDGILAHRIGLVIGVGESALIMITALIGGIVGGLGALTGSLLVSFFRTKQNARKHF